MTKIYTIDGIPYEPDFDENGDVVFRKAARRRVPSPGQLGLFGGHNEGDTKVENGVTYRLNSHSRWERVDAAPAKQKSQKKVVPEIKDGKKVKKINKFTFHVDDAHEAERLEAIANDMGATRINQEGWTTDYGGNGILMFIESPLSKREWKQIISGFNSVNMAK
jgi:hypothetical protein